MKKQRVVILMLGVLLCAARVTQAIPITIEISGEVTDGYGSLWGGGLHVGAGFTGSYTYDSATPNTSTSTYRGQYVHNSPYGIEVLLGGFDFKTVTTHTSQFQITISDNGPNGDSYQVDSNQSIPLSNGATVNAVSWGLYDTNSMISSTDLPIDAPTVSQWPGNVLYISGKDTLGNGYLIHGTVTQAVLIPEPLTGLLLMTGVLLLRRRR